MYGLCVCACVVTVQCKPLRVAVDIHVSYTEHMTEREIRSLCSQISLCYTLNSRFLKCTHTRTPAPAACELSITQVFGSPPNDKMAYLNHHLHDKRNASKWNPQYCQLVSTALTDLYPISSLVYLSADSPNTLTDLSPLSVYVIGGLVDRSPYPWQSLSRAVDIDCKHARLPIKEYASSIGNPFLHARVNQLNVDLVLHILLNRYHHPDWNWHQIIQSVLPRRMYTRRGKFPHEWESIHAKQVNDNHNDNFVTSKLDRK